ncbi:hypothetical protein BX600DRAFT_432511 [Xylariales sp. PMI_506]|nr:hypothetical protein BX600DRAFT_432511 [Xylariales sp. PMI_506]
MSEKEDRSLLIILAKEFATVQHPDKSPRGDGRSSTRAASTESEQQKSLPVRERLRQWEIENPNPADATLSDFAFAGELSNIVTRPQNISMTQFTVASPLFDGDELSDLRADDSTLQAGDLVELSSEGTRRPSIAICLGRFNGYEHYYANSGKWFSTVGVQPLFVVHRFVEPVELEALISEISLHKISPEEVNALQDLGHGPSRSTGAPLLKKMLDFTQEAESVYQANAGTLDASSSFIGDPLNHRYLTLFEIADLLLPLSMKKVGKFSEAALYAVHRSLLQDEVFFRPLGRTGHRRSYLFEVSPLSEVRVVQNVEKMVREYLDAVGGTRKKELEGHAADLSKFLNSARSAIDKSRRARKVTPHGMIGPSNSRASRAKWSNSDREILNFLEIWASYQKFPAHSRLQCLGSAIIRCIDRYDEMKFTPATGWTCLQELGWITPWDIQARYALRFPNVEVNREGGFSRPFFGMLDRHLKPDSLSKIRKRWDNMTAYCIDSESTVDIDDAVSVERTSDPTQYWIHVHVADPASSISADTPVAKYAELVPETIYLQGHFSRMLPGDISIDKFSLAPNRPTLTFSALVDDRGNILDYKITPGILQDVVYMTGEDVNTALGEMREDPLASDEEMTIGQVKAFKAPERAMTRPQDLTPGQKDDLSVLSMLGKSLHAERLKKGATPYFPARPQPQVDLGEVTQTSTPEGVINATGDPSIRIQYSKRVGTDLVENTMRLAGEVAGRWCSERGIPIPYRTQPHGAPNAALIQQYTQEMFQPLLAAGVQPDDSQWRHLRSLIGSDELSTTPGPHYTMGVDVYAKATSPLRRFSDLIVHWQIEAALLEEQKRGTSLVGNKKDSFLPFTRQRLDRMLPMLRVRERQARLLANGPGADQWILQALVRAWKFGEAPLPPTFKFTVSRISGRSVAIGQLNWFDRSAFLRAEHMNGLMRMVNVRIGDVLEVKLVDVNVHGNMITVEAVSVIESKHAKEAAAALNESGIPASAEAVVDLVAPATS